MSYYTQISKIERARIFEGLKNGLSMGDIANFIGRDKSSVSREIKRNSDHIGYLYPADAQAMTSQRKARHGTKVNRDAKLMQYVIEKLNQDWAPDVIAGKWSQVNPAQPITREAIYSFIYAQQNKHLELWKLLSHKKPKRGIVRKKRGKIGIPNRVSVHERPVHIEQREEAGHFESDLFFNSGSMSENVLNIVDRKSRMTFLEKNSSKHSAPIIQKIAERVGQFAKTITFDNGTEFSEHSKLHSLNGGINTFFCDPGSPWQKGSVENSNKFLRRYLPFKMLAKDVTQEMLDSVAHTINNIPRRSLNFLTPYEAFVQDYKDSIDKMESRMKRALPAQEADMNSVFNKNYLSVALQY
jgi:IS30 family transposase